MPTDTDLTIQAALNRSKASVTDAESRQWRVANKAKLEGVKLRGWQPHVEFEGIAGEQLVVVSRPDPNRSS